MGSSRFRATTSAVRVPDTYTAPTAHSSTAAANAPAAHRFFSFRASWARSTRLIIGFSSLPAKAYAVERTFRSPVFPGVRAFL